MEVSHFSHIDLQPRPLSPRLNIPCENVLFGITTLLKLTLYLVSYSQLDVTSTSPQ